MKYEKSCGAIVFRKDNKELYYLVLQHIGGHWSFSKGHVEDNETEIETAQREIREETGLVVKIDGRFRLVNKYSPGVNTIKEVIYFVAESSISTVQLQVSEIVSMKWRPFTEAQQLLTFDLDKAILKKANDYLLIASKT